MERGGLIGMLFVALLVGWTRGMEIRAAYEARRMEWGYFWMTL